MVEHKVTRKVVRFGNTYAILLHVDTPLTPTGAKRLYACLGSQGIEYYVGEPPRYAKCRLISIQYRRNLLYLVLPKRMAKVYHIRPGDICLVTLRDENPILMVRKLMPYELKT